LEIGADSADVSDVVHAISEFVENAGRRGVARRGWKPVRLGDRPGAVEGLPRRRAGPRSRTCYCRADARAIDCEFASLVGDAGRIIVSGDLDLSRVTHLGSAGVSALAAARDRARRQGGDCVLVVPPGSPAHQAKNVFAEE
jgi:hypothetical protein